MVNTLHNWQREFELSSDWSRRTRRFDFKVLDRIVEFLGVDTNPRNVFQSHIKMYRDYRYKQGVKATTVRKELCIGRRFYKYLIQMEFIEPFFNPFEGIQCHPPPEITPAETEKATD